MAGDRDRHAHEHDDLPAELRALGEQVRDAYAGVALTPEQQLRHLRRLRAPAAAPSATPLRDAALPDDGLQLVPPPPGDTTAPPRRPAALRVAGVAAALAAGLVLLIVGAAALVALLRGPLAPGERDDDALAPQAATPTPVVRDTFVPSGGEITFSSPYGTRTQLSIVAADASELRVVSRRQASYWSPTWAPDGKRIAFASALDGESHIFLMNADGSDVTQLTSYTGGNGPVWSPDGARIAFQALVEGRVGLYVMHADRSSGARNVSGTLAEIWHARWSPDGSQIVFESNGSLYVTAIEGDDAGIPRRLADGSSPEWSPDGSRIGYFAWDSGDADLFVVGVDGGEPLNLTDTEDRNEFAPVWSPDARHLAYSVEQVADTSAGMRLAVIHSDGSEARVLGDFAARSSIFAAWSPDGRRIAFTAQPLGGEDWTLSIVAADGDGYRELFDVVTPNSAPIWRPEWWKPLDPTASGTPDTTQPRLVLSADAGACDATLDAVASGLEPGVSVRIFAEAQGGGEYVAVTDALAVADGGSLAAEIDLRRLAACASGDVASEQVYTLRVVIDRGTPVSPASGEQRGDLTRATASFRVLPVE